MVLDLFPAARQFSGLAIARVTNNIVHAKTTAIASLKRIYKNDVGNYCVGHQPSLPSANLMMVIYDELDLILRYKSGSMSSNIYRVD